MTSTVQNPLTRIVKRILDVFRLLILALIIIWPIAVIAMTIGHNSDPDTWGVDIDVFSRFQINLAELPVTIDAESGVRQPTIGGQTAVKIDTTSLSAFYTAAVMTEIGAFIGLYIITQLRALFASLLKGLSFSRQNSGYIKRIGIVFIGWSLINPFFQYFGGKMILSEYALGVPGIELHPAFEIPIFGVVVGLTLLVFAALLDEAANIQETQELTI